MTVKAVRCDSVLRATISGRSSSSARSEVTDAQIEPGGVPHEERHHLRGGVLGRHDEVALVLAVLVVDDDDHPAGGDGGDRLRRWLRWARLSPLRWSAEPRAV